MRLSNIVTKKGDSGKTSIGSGERVSKDHPRVHAMGAVDHLNSTIGWSMIEANNIFKDDLKEIQNDLFDLGADLATPISKEKEKYPALRIKKGQIDKIENKIDYYNKSLKPLNSFILPGGSEASTLLHQSRTIARRAERDTSLLSSVEDINIQSLIYLNRLSDLLFVLCRVLNENGLNDVLWIPGLNQK